MEDFKKTRRWAEVKGLWLSELHNAIPVWSLSTYFISLLRGNKRCALKKGDHTPNSEAFILLLSSDKRDFSGTNYTKGNNKGSKRKSHSCPRLRFDSQLDLTIREGGVVWLVMKWLVDYRHEICTVGQVPQAWLVYFFMQLRHHQSQARAEGGWAPALLPKVPWLMPKQISAIRDRRQCQRVTAPAHPKLSACHWPVICLSLWSNTNIWPYAQMSDTHLPRIRMVPLLCFQLYMEEKMGHS